MISRGLYFFYLFCLELIGMVCFEGFFGATISSNTACLFRLWESLKYVLNLPSSSVSWTLCCALPSLGNPENFPLTQLSPELRPVYRPVQFSRFLGPLAEELKDSYLSSQIVYVPFRVPCMLKLSLIFSIKTLLLKKLANKKHYTSKLTRPKVYSSQWTLIQLK